MFYYCMPSILIKVFIAELMRGAGQAWHKGCFTCNTCNKRIDSSNLCERESEIYCRGNAIRNILCEKNDQLYVHIRAMEILYFFKLQFSLIILHDYFVFSLLRQSLWTQRIWIWHRDDIRRNIVSDRYLKSGL